MTRMPAYFKSNQSSGHEVLEPCPRAAGHWGRDRLRGPAVTSLLARASRSFAEGRPELRPARATFELFRPARMVPTASEARLVHQSSRLAVIDSALVQAGEVVARAHVLLLATSPTDESPVWTSSPSFAPPAHHLRPDPNGQLYSSGDGEWTSVAQDHANRLRKQVWHHPCAVVEGELATPFERAAAASDITNLAVNWGERGIEYINADVTLSMTRLPEGLGIGLAANERWENSGISVGSAVLFDRSGSFGLASVTALYNAHRTVTVRTAFPTC